MSRIFLCLQKDSRQAGMTIIGTEFAMDHSLAAEIREGLENTIENFPDSIVTFDLNGVVTSWNKGAEEMYGFSREEAMGSFLPFVPAFLADAERTKIGRIRDGEIFKDYETVSQRKDGTIIDASLTVSPLKDTGGRVVGAICISRAISDKKRIEKELVRRNQELLERAGGNKTTAAKLLGISYDSLRYQVRKFGLE